MKYKCPIKCVFLLFYSFICDFLKFPSVKYLLNCSQHIASSGIRILNTEKVGVVKAVFRFFQSSVFHRCKETGLIDFPEKRAPTEVKCVLPIGQILRNFTEGNARKFTVSFAFCAYADVIKYPKSADVFLRAHVDY